MAKRDEPDVQGEGKLVGERVGPGDEDGATG